MTDPRGSPPWQFSEHLGGHYVYVPSRDAIVIHNGPSFPRPQGLTIEQLRAARWEFQSTYRSYANHTGSQGLPEQTTPRIPPTQRGLSEISSGLNTLRIGQQVPGPRLIDRTNPQNHVRTRIYPNPPRQPDEELQAQGLPSGPILLGSPGNAEQLWPNYKMRPSAFYSVGRVFMVLWAEPAGETTTVVTSVEIQNGRFGQRIHSKVRRFVVIRAGRGYCSALPIMTYGGRGVGKDRVTKSEHAIIYTGKVCPNVLPGERPSRGEEGMRPQPIRVDPDLKGDKLDPISRLDFGQVHTVQHNIKARSFGKVNNACLTALEHQFNNVWRGVTETEEDDEDEDEDEDDDDDDDEDGDEDEDESEDEEDDEEDPEADSEEEDSEADSEEEDSEEEEEG